MAGPYVHCMVSREALKEIFNDTLFNRYREITNPSENALYFPYVCLGSVSPDYPYPAAAMPPYINYRKDVNGWAWGDKFHKQNTGAFIDFGVQGLRADEAQGRSASPAFQKKAAWLMGYYSHVITDLVIHAVVYKLVGGCYETHSSPHLHCEVIQDPLLFYDIYSDPPQELIHVHFLRILQKCQEETAFSLDPNQATTYVLDKDIENFWHSILKQNYSDFYNNEKPQIDAWHRVYSFLMKLGTSVAARDVEPGKAYRSSTDIAANEPEDKARYYSDVILPDGTTGNYKDKVFYKTVEEVTTRLKALLGALDSTDAYLDFKKTLGEWNLDKGTLDSEHPQFAAWPPGETEYPFNCPGDPPRRA